MNRVGFDFSLESTTPLSFLAMSPDLPPEINMARSGLLVTSNIGRRGR